MSTLHSKYHQPTSIYAELMARWASSTAVSKPNVLSIKSISLSMVFGTATTETFSFLLRHCKYREYKTFNMKIDKSRRQDELRVKQFFFLQTRVSAPILGLQ